MAEPYVKELLSSGEVVLIETRQHWMAAVRFVLRPIFLIGAAVLLWLLNGWLDFNDDGLLDIINQLVGWAIVIMLVVAIIWLPIDLARWWSRRYILTNRRAMFLQGLLQKNSFDASLEQINDIGMTQSVVGRAFGYADLTLFTASDQANPTYDQLMDGVQFKKAVMDAKEAIRVGTPLQSLPDGFVVKGGTNEASMRAEGKLEAPAAGAVGGPDAAEASGVAATESGVAGVGGAAGAAAAVAASTVIEPSGEVPAAAGFAPVANAVVEPTEVAGVEAIAEAESAPALVVAPVAETAPVMEAAEQVEDAAEPMVEAADDAAEQVEASVAEAAEGATEPIHEAIEQQSDEAKLA